MKPSGRAAELIAYHTELAAESAARRCRCGAPVEVVVIGRGAATSRPRSALGRRMMSASGRQARRSAEPLDQVCVLDKIDRRLTQYPSRPADTVDQAAL